MRKRIHQLIAAVLALAAFTATPPAAFAQASGCSQRDIKAFGHEYNSAIACLTPKEAADLAKGVKEMGFGSSDPQKALDFTFGVIGMAVPGAGAILGAGKMGLGMLGLFDAPDPMAVLAGRVGKLEQQMHQLSARVDALEERFGQDIADGKLNDLSFVKGDLARCAQYLRPGPLLGTSAANSAEVRGCRGELQADMEVFHRRGIWTWSDYHLKVDPETGQYHGLKLAPRFSPLPALPLYQASLALWMAAVEIETGGNTARIRKEFKAEIDKQRNWLTNQLSRDIGELISCSVKLTAVYPANGICSVEDVCWDHLVRERRSFARPFDSFTPKINSNGRCDAQFFPGEFERYGEDNLEMSYGMEIVQELLRALTSLENTGTTKKPAQNRFPCRTFDANYLYTINANGELGWRMHEITRECGEEAKRPWQENLITHTREARVSPWSASPDRTAVVTQALPATKSPATPKSGVASGVLSSHTVREAATPSQPNAIARPYVTGANRPELITVKAVATDQSVRISHELRAAKPLGDKWNSFRLVLPGGHVQPGRNKGAFVIYGLTNEGHLKWYRHEGSSDGSAVFKGPLDVPASWNWNAYRKLIPAGEGVIYGIAQDGSLVWHRHMDLLNGSARWQGPRGVASGYGELQHVVAGGQGILYTVGARDVLTWQRHIGYLDGSMKWSASVPVDSGWSQFTQVFSPGNGHLYALTSSGQLSWSQHLGYLTGENKWHLAARVADGLLAIPVMFPLLWGEPPDLGVR